MSVLDSQSMSGESSDGDFQMLITSDEGTTNVAEWDPVEYTPSGDLMREVQCVRHASDVVMHVCSDPRMVNDEQRIQAIRHRVSDVYRSAMARAFCENYDQLHALATVTGVDPDVASVALFATNYPKMRSDYLALEFPHSVDKRVFDAYDVGPGSDDVRDIVKEYTAVKQFIGMSAAEVERFRAPVRLALQNVDKQGGVDVEDVAFVHAAKQFLHVARLAHGAAQNGQCWRFLFDGKPPHLGLWPKVAEVRAHSRCDLSVMCEPVGVGQWHVVGKSVPGVTGMCAVRDLPPGDVIGGDDMSVFDQSSSDAYDEFSSASYATSPALVERVMFNHVADMLTWTCPQWAGRPAESVVVGATAVLGRYFRDADTLTFLRKGMCSPVCQYPAFDDWYTGLISCVDHDSCERGAMVHEIASANFSSAFKAVAARVERPDVTRGGLCWLALFDKHSADRVGRLALWPTVREVRAHKPTYPDSLCVCVGENLWHVVQPGDDVVVHGGRPPVIAFSALPPDARVGGRSVVQPEGTLSSRAFQWLFKSALIGPRTYAPADVVQLPVVEPVGKVAQVMAVSTLRVGVAVVYRYVAIPTYAQLGQYFVEIDAVDGAVCVVSGVGGKLNGVQLNGTWGVASASGEHYVFNADTADVPAFCIHVVAPATEIRSAGDLLCDIMKEANILAKL